MKQSADLTSPLTIDALHENFLPGEACWPDYIALLKPRVMSLVVFTALVGLVLAPQPIHPLTGLLAIICIAVGGGASGALNMWYEADIDALMNRTKTRPIPSGLIHRDSVLIFALTLAGFSVLIMGIFINWFAASFLAFTIFFYAVIYTMWLKPRTPQNIVIGGAAGAFPPMIGWAAATGSISMMSFILFLIIFMWTPPHFWALSLFVTSDYQKAGIPMLPNVRGVHATKNQIIFYSWGMALVGLAPYIFNFASLFYAVLAAGAGGAFIIYAHVLARAPEGGETRQAAKKLFLFSLFYLFSLFSLLLIEHVATHILKLIMR